MERRAARGGGGAGDGELLERVGSMDGEVNALVESLRAGAGRLAADLSAVETGMGELYDAASGVPPTRPPQPPSRRSSSTSLSRRVRSNPSSVRSRRSWTARSRRRRSRPRRSRRERRTQAATTSTARA